MAMELGGKKTMIEFTWHNPETDDVSLAFRRNGEPFADFNLRTEEGKLTAEQRAILQVLPKVLDISGQAWSRNQTLREYGRIERLEGQGDVRVDVNAHLEIESALTPDQAELIAPLFV